jgi:hypothetical protein
MKFHRQLAICLTVLAAFTAGQAPAAVVAHLKFNDGSGTVASDSSGNGHSGTLKNMAPASDWLTTGVVGGSLDFNASDTKNDYVIVPDSNQLDFGANDFTVSAWIYKRASTSSFSNIWGVNKWNTGGQPGTNEWSLTIGNSSSGQGGSNEPSFSIETTTNVRTSAQSQTELTLNAWHFLVGVRHGDTLELYQDGVLAATTYIGPVTINNAGRDLLIASAFTASTTSSNYNQNVNGIFDDVGVLTGAWNAGEVKGVYNLALDPTLNYDLSQAQMLFDLYDTRDYSTGETVGGLTWYNTSGLIGNAGDLTLSGGIFYLQLDAQGTGVATAPYLPEPSSLGLFALGMLFALPRRKKH